MSSVKRSAARKTNADDPGPPYVGALLRLCWQRVRARIDSAIREAGFTDLLESHFPVFSYPPPHGVRPSDLARQIRMSRQATNHIIGQLEALGYLERRAVDGSDRRRVYLTDRAWRVRDAIYACLRDIQNEWAAEIGPDRFRDFMAALRQLAADEVQPADPSRRRLQRRDRPPMSPAPLAIEVTNGTAQATHDRHEPRRDRSRQHR